jgi:hypothetical protein
MTIYKPTDTIVCPHCGEKQEDQADAYTIPGRVGEGWKQTEMCHVCDGEFTAWRQEDNTIVIEKK